jgi:hypothetical protein
LIKLLQSEPGPLTFSLTLNLALALSQSEKAEEGKKVLEEFLQRPDITPLEKERAQSILREFA